MDLAAIAAKVGGIKDDASTFRLTAVEDGGGEEKVELNADQANVNLTAVATIKLQSRVARKRVKNVKRDPKTGMEIKNEWQRDTDIMCVRNDCHVNALRLRTQMIRGYGNDFSLSNELDE